MAPFRSAVITAALCACLSACNGEGSTPASSEDSSNLLPSGATDSTETSPPVDDGDGDGRSAAPKHLRDAAFCDKVDLKLVGVTFGSINGAGTKLTESTKPSAAAPAWSCEVTVDLGGGTTGRVVMRLQPEGATASSISRAVKSFTAEHEGQGDASCSSTDMSEWPIGGLTTCSSSKAAAAMFQGLFGKGSFGCSAIFSAPNAQRVQEVAYAICPSLLRKVAQR